MMIMIIAQIVGKDWIGVIKMENKRETNLTIARLNKMFDVEKLIEKEPELFEELVKDYPLKDGVYLFEVIADEKK